MKNVRLQNGKRSLATGGLTLASPALVALAEANALFGKECPLLLVSVGTGHDPHKVRYPAITRRKDWHKPLSKHSLMAVLSANQVKESDRVLLAKVAESKWQKAAVEYHRFDWDASRCYDSMNNTLMQTWKEEARDFVDANCGQMLAVGSALVKHLIHAEKGEVPHRVRIQQPLEEKQCVQRPAIVELRVVTEKTETTVKQQNENATENKEQNRSNSAKPENEQLSNDQNNALPKENGSEKITEELL